MKFGRYEVVDELGKGAMGVVYSAHDPQIDRIVALKALRSDYVDDEYFVQRFFKEAVAIGRLSHPNIVTVYDVGRDQGTLYIAMEFLMGRPLSDYAGETRLSADRVVRIGIQMADALDYAHGKGVVHRDIKPANVLLLSDDRVKITDFGIAHIDDPTATRQTQAGEILGTPVYMSPEQVMGETPDCRSDIYALGVILYELSTGRRPFEAKNLAGLFRAIAEEKPPPPSELNPHISRGFSDLILRCLAKRPEDRFQTGKFLGDALQSCAADNGVCEMDQPPATPGPTTVSGRNWTRPLAMGAVLILLLAVGVWQFRPDSPPTPVPSPESTPESRPAPGPESTAPAEEPAAPSAKALLSIQSDPASAEIFIDGESRGTAPMDLSLPLGKHEVRLRLDGYHDWRAQLDLTEAESIPLRIRLQPMP
jgi:eukaryotic-like serine/threonine-protein kinase